MQAPDEKTDFQKFIGDDAASENTEKRSLGSRLERYAAAHKRTLEMAAYVAVGPRELRLSHDLENCGSYLLFRDYYTLGQVRLAAACFCKKHLLCPLCAIRRGAKLLKSYLGKLHVIQEEKPGLKPYLVTLTVKNGDDLKERFAHLHNSMKKYTQARRNHLKGRGPMVEYAKASGSVISYEFKRGKNSGGWHPHSHAVWLCEEMPDQDKLADEWQKITGDSFIVDVRPINTEDDAIGGFLEVFKYAVKFSDLPLEDNWEGYKILKGRRMIASMGDFRGVQEPDDLGDDLLPEDAPYVELLFRYKRGAGYSLDAVDPHRQP